MNNFSVSFSTIKAFPNFALNIKAGNLQTSGLYSKLKDPLLSSSVNPFSVSVSELKGTSVSSPGISSYSNPVSFFVQQNFKNNDSILKQALVNYLYVPEDNTNVFSGFLSLKFSKKINAGISSVAGYFSIEENPFSTWFTTDDFYFHQDKILCFGSNLYTNINSSSFSFSLFTFESPFGNLQNIYKTENKLNFEPFTFTTSFLYNQNSNLITASEKKIPGELQIKNGIIYKNSFCTKIPLSFKTGLNSYFCSPFSEAQKDLKISAGLQFSSLFCSSSLIFTGKFLVTEENYSIKNELDSISLQQKNTFSIKDLDLNFSETFSLSQSNNFKTVSTTEKYSLGINFAASIYQFTTVSFSNSSSLLFTQKNGTLTKQTFENSLNLSIKHYHLTTDIKLVFQI